ncbi:MAG TPA: GW dipeptide domain-containing protein [Candidatus Sulfomarinibacteraceae bacterium]|nr:GW dipeptide domain-containing protein [Candidatus Sulfomarinibacteraceae bacterium]
MNIGATKSWLAGLWLISLLALAALACAQAGEVLTPEEATERARSPAANEDTAEGIGGDFGVGDTATLTGRSFLVNLLDAPAGRITAGQERGVQVTIQQIVEEEGELWYRVEAPGGRGWVRVDNLEPPEIEEAVEGEETEVDGDEETAVDIAAGDTAYLIGNRFIVDYYDRPGPGGRIISGQQRGAEVTVVEVSQADGETWYLIDSAAGQGWVPAENLTTEAP